MNLNDRKNDFVTLFIEGDLRVMPVDMLGGVLDDYMDQSVDDNQFLQSKIFFMDPTILGAGRLPYNGSSM